MQLTSAVIKRVYRLKLAMSEAVKTPSGEHFVPVKGSGGKTYGWVNSYSLAMIESFLPTDGERSLDSYYLSRRLNKISKVYENVFSTRPKYKFAVVKSEESVNTLDNLRFRVTPRF